MKKIHYSRDVDALLIELSDSAIAYAEEDSKMILHYSEDDKLVLIEILDLAQMLEEELYDDLENDPEAMADIQEALDDYAAGDYLPHEEFITQRKAFQVV
jgi:uncharacterized protein YuzE